MEKLPFGVNLVGHFEAETGLGQGVRAAERALRISGVPLTCINVRDCGSRNTEGFKKKIHPTYAINLIHLNPPTSTRWLFENSKRCYQIAYWAWEQSVLPPSWAKDIQYFDEIWVPSEFTRNAVAAVSPRPVFRAPHPIVIDDTPPWTKASWGLNETDFVFIYCFDFRANLERKNPEGLIAAFSKAFAPGDGVTLVLKANHGEGRSEYLRLKNLVSRFPHIRLFNETLTHAQTLSWMNAADAYVSLHRSEGFGLPIFEAMALGKPVVATGYSGVMDYLENVSLLVDFELNQPKNQHPLYWSNVPWAEPNLEHAAFQMRRLVESSALYDQLSTNGKALVETRLSPAIIGKRLKNRLNSIWETSTLNHEPWQSRLPGWTRSLDHYVGNSWQGTRHFLLQPEMAIQNSINELMADSNEDKSSRFHALNNSLIETTLFSWKKILLSPIRMPMALIIKRLVWPYWKKQFELNNLLFEATHQSLRQLPKNQWPNQRDEQPLFEDLPLPPRSLSEPSSSSWSEASESSSEASPLSSLSVVFPGSVTGGVPGPEGVTESVPEISAPEQPKITSTVIPKNKVRIFPSFPRPESLGTN